MTLLNKLGISGLITIVLGIIIVPVFVKNPCTREAIYLNTFLICMFILSFIKERKHETKYEENPNEDLIDNVFGLD